MARNREKTGSRLNLSLSQTENGGSLLCPFSHFAGLRGRWDSSSARPNFSSIWSMNSGGLWGRTEKWIFYAVQLGQTLAACEQGSPSVDSTAVLPD